jgi:hypothetical protein
MLVICADWMKDIRLLRSFLAGRHRARSCLFSFRNPVPTFAEAGAGIGDESRLAG